MDKRVLISVVIPVYNVEKYIEKCLQSVVLQSYENLEIICVNDGSKDKSRDILSVYRKKQYDDRIIIIDQDNKGLSVARNNGILKAKGKYIYLLDSDDWLLPGALEMLVDVAEKEKVDIVSGGVLEYSQHSNSFKNYKKNRTLGYIYTRSHDILNLEIVVWNKLYRRDVFTEGRFCPNMIHEDDEFHWRVLAKGKKIFAVSQNVVCYRRHPDSITGINRTKDDSYQENFIKVIGSALNVCKGSSVLMLELKKYGLKRLKSMKKCGIPCRRYEKYIEEKLGIRDKPVNRFILGILVSISKRLMRTKAITFRSIGDAHI